MARAGVPMKTTPLLRIAFVFLAAALAAGVLWGQEGLSGGAISYEENPIFYTDTKEVVVPVTVLGPKGEYVSGLEKIDFKIYDMTKALDKALEITDIYLLEKTGGKSGAYRRNPKRKGA